MSFTSQRAREWEESSQRCASSCFGARGGAGSLRQTRDLQLNVSEWHRIDLLITVERSIWRCTLRLRAAKSPSKSPMSGGTSKKWTPSRVAGSIQYRPGPSVHQQRCVQRNVGCRRNPNLHGRPRSLDGQRFYRTALALAQIQGRGPEGLRRRARSQGRHWLLDRILNLRRPHQALANLTPMAVWRDGVTGALGETAVS